MPNANQLLRPFISYTKYELGYQFEHNNPNEVLLNEVAIRLNRGNPRTVKFFTVLLRAVGYTPSQVLNLFGFDSIDEPNLKPDVYLHANSTLPSRPYISLNKYELGMLLEHGHQNINVLHEISCRVSRGKLSTVRFFGPVLHAYGIDIMDLHKYFGGEQ